jgi:hypothetical protein
LIWRESIFFADEAPTDSHKEHNGQSFHPKTFRTQPRHISNSPAPFRFYGMNDLTLFGTVNASAIGVNKLTAFRSLETRPEITRLFSARQSSNVFGR